MRLVLSFLIFFSVHLAAEPYFFFSPEMRASHLVGYSDEERSAIYKDLEVVRSICLGKAEPNREHPVYLATAGAPGARKSTILEHFIEAYLMEARGAYLDPDQRALKFMAHTYYAKSLNAKSVVAHGGEAAARKAAYEKWRGGSNYITLTLIEEAFANRMDVIHGGTSTGSHISALYEKLHAAGYSIVLILCSCEDAMRMQAIDKRNTQQCFYQSTPEDAIVKGRFFSRKMADYFTYADRLYLYWSDALDSQERLAAVYEGGDLKIEDQDAYLHFVAKYEKDRAQWLREGVELPHWEALHR